MVEKSGVEKSGVEKSGVQMSTQSLGLNLGVETSRVEMPPEEHFNPGVFNPRLGVGKSGVEKSGV